ncbi:MAG: transposase [Bacteroidales bacterium]|nr:transposase [Bacteroidales bacterium]
MQNNQGDENSNPNTPNYAAYFTNSFGLPEEWHIGHLPRRNKENLIQFITFRLADSLPQDVLKKIELDIKALTASEKDIAKRKRYQKYLDRGYGCCALKHPKMTQTMYNALKHHDGDKYNLLAWSIMPNHVHVLIKANSNISRILQSWKSFTGRWALKNNETYSFSFPKDVFTFWMPDYWDRFIRDSKHFNATVKYILDNPKKAKLPKGSVAYRFTACAWVDEAQS